MHAYAYANPLFMLQDCSVDMKSLHMDCNVNMLQASHQMHNKHILDLSDSQMVPNSLPSHLEISSSGMGQTYCQTKLASKSPELHGR